MEYNETWYGNEDSFDQLLKENRVHWTNNGDGIPRIKIYLSEALISGQAGINFFTHDRFGSNQEGSAELRELMKAKGLFDNPKPTRLLQSVLKLSTINSDIILDFFAGTSTTAHAVMQLNAEDGGNRKFIMVQYPEELDDTEKRKKENKEAIAFCDELGVPRTISEIGKERIRRAGEKIKEEAGEEAKDLDIGFKVFKTADTNIRWIAQENGMNVSQTQLDGSSMSDKDRRDFMPDATDIDVAYEILLRQYDIPLSANMETLTDIGPRTYCFADTVVVCLEENVTSDIIDKIAAIEPMPHKVLFRDSAFGKDISLKVNTMERFDAMMKKHSDKTKQPYTVEFL
ncbi:MAG: DNA methyltransferase [Methanomicrobium sp.]|nr:DNA methyltransferase [Methanomicrobium sp.]